MAIPACLRDALLHVQQLLGHLLHLLAVVRQLAAQVLGRWWEVWAGRERGVRRHAGECR